MSDKKTPVLEVKELGIDFGGLTAVNDLDMSIYNEEIIGLIGPNGAGKTTVFNLLTKVYNPTRGSIFFDGKDTAGKTVVDINKAGIARTFQNIRLFDNLLLSPLYSAFPATTQRSVRSKASPESFWRSWN